MFIHIRIQSTLAITGNCLWNRLTEQRLEGVGVDTDILAGLDASLWAGSDDGVETVLIGSPVHPVCEAIRSHEGVRSLADDRLLALSEVLQHSTLRSDLAIAQLVTAWGHKWTRLDMNSLFLIRH